MCENHCNDTECNAELSPNSHTLRSRELSLVSLSSACSCSMNVQAEMSIVGSDSGCVTYKWGWEIQSSTGPTVLQYCSPGKANSLNMAFFFFVLVVD